MGERVMCPSRSNGLALLFSIKGRLSNWLGQNRLLFLEYITESGWISSSNGLISLVCCCANQHNILGQIYYLQFIYNDDCYIKIFYGSLLSFYNVL